jgi:peptide subunit release factor RF-3
MKETWWNVNAVQTSGSGGPLRFDAVPRFEPERFAILRNQGLSRHKQFHRGLAQLEEEGAIDRLPYKVARHVVGDPAAVARILWPYSGALRVRDRQGRLITLFASAREATYCAERNPDVVYRPLSDSA